MGTCQNNIKGTDILIKGEGENEIGDETGKKIFLCS